MSFTSRYRKALREKCNTHNYKNIIVFTKGFKTCGEFCTDGEIRDLITIKNARIYSYATNCECETTAPYYDVNWLNIFAEDIISFSFVE